MGSRVLIITQARDGHAYAVANAVNLEGGEAIVWHTSDFPLRSQETILFEGGLETVSFADSTIHQVNERYDVVWNRRPSRHVNPAVIDPADRDFVELGCRDFRQSLYNLISPSALWVNPHGAANRASRKIEQMSVAHKAGMQLPDTLFTNDPEQVRAFIRRHGGQIVFKPLRTLPWRGDEKFYMPYTATLTEEQLVEDDLLRVAPGIYQQLIPKAFELRVTMIGGRAWTALIRSQETTAGRLDWRMAYHELRMEPYELPEAVEALCNKVLDGLGLVFGCFDFIVTPGGDYVFLEVNQMGQFLFVEEYCGLPLLQAFTYFLLHGRDGWGTAGLAGPRYADVRQQAAADVEEHEAHHEPLPDTYFNEGKAAQEPRAIELG
jgi:hypothetical protein